MTQMIRWLRIAHARLVVVSSARSPILATLRLVPGASAPLTVAVTVLVVFDALLPAAFALASGALVGSVPGAVAHGWQSAAGTRLILSIAAAVALFILLQVSGPALRSLADALGRRVEGHLRIRVMKATLSPPGVAHLEDPEVVDRVADAQSIGTGYTTVKDAVTGMAVVSSNTLAGVFAAAVVTAYRWWLALGLLVAYGSVTLARAHHLGRTVGALRGHARRFRRSSYIRDLALTPGAAKELRVFGLSNWIGDRFTDAWRLAMAGFWRDRPKGRWLPPVGGVVIGGALGITFAFLGTSAARGEITLGELATFASATAGVAALYAIGPDNINISYGTASVPAALELEAAVIEPRFKLEGTKSADGLPRSGIRFEGVWFRYPGQEKHVFEGLDLEIPAGRSLAIVGRNGAGKTTLVKLLARLYDPTGGRITVDGIDLADIDPRAWQRRIGAIFQDFVHYPLSAADNVGFGAMSRSGDREAVSAAAERAGANELVEALPHGWDTVLSRRVEGGTDLSGGQWQRVALARALFAVDAGASVLILDEPTAALDVRSEAAFYDRFLALTTGVTTLVISHRFSTVRRAEHIVVIEEGNVVEAGDHESLMHADRRYAHMFRLQAAHLAADRDEKGDGHDG